MDNTFKWVTALGTIAVLGTAGYMVMKQNPQVAADVKKAAKTAGRKVTQVKDMITEDIKEMK
jgi:hypothetical protein